MDSPYFIYSNITDAEPLSPKEFGFGVVEWSIQSTLRTLESIEATKGLFSEIICKSQGKLQILLVSLQCAAYYVFVKKLLPSNSVHEDFLYGLKDGFLTLDDGKHQKVLSMLFLKYRDVLQEDLAESSVNSLISAKLPTDQNILWFSKSSQVVKNDLEVFYTKESEGLILDGDPKYLLFTMQKIDEHGFLFLSEFLPQMGLLLVE